MRIYTTIPGLLICVLTLLCCSKNATSVGSEEITVDTGTQYILFDSGISTRGAHVTSEYLDDDFAVLGYQYRGSWTATDVRALPNVFKRWDEAKDEEVIALPQIVTYDENDGIYSYEPLQKWSGNKYSFFGYYPIDNSIKPFDDGEIQEGSPYITYTLPVSQNPGDLIDVMTAAFIDTDITMSPNVQMEMSHRLSAIDVSARNYFTHKDENGSTHAITVEVSNLQLSLTTYAGAKIYLDGSKPTIPIKDENGNDLRVPLTYTLVESSNPSIDKPWAPNGLDISPNGSDDLTARLLTTQTGANATSILILPQSQLYYTLVIDYYKKYKLNEDDEEYVYLTDSENNPINFHFDAPNYQIPLLEEGGRYYIEISFTSDAVSVNVIAIDQWDVIDKDGIKQEFE